MADNIIIKKINDLEKNILTLLRAKYGSQINQVQAKIFTAKIAQYLILTYAQNIEISNKVQSKLVGKEAEDLIKEFKHSTEFNAMLSEIQTELNDLAGLFQLSQAAVQLLGHSRDSSVHTAFSQYQERKKLQKELLNYLADVLMFVAVLVILAFCIASPSNINIEPALMIAGALLAILVKTFEYALDQNLSQYRKNTISAILAQQQNTIHSRLEKQDTDIYTLSSCLVI